MALDVDQLRTGLEDYATLWSGSGKTCNRNIKSYNVTLAPA